MGYHKISLKLLHHIFENFSDKHLCMTSILRYASNFMLIKTQQRENLEQQGKPGLELKQKFCHCQNVINCVLKSFPTMAGWCIA